MRPMTWETLDKRRLLSEAAEKPHFGVCVSLPTSMKASCLHWRATRILNPKVGRAAFGNEQPLKAATKVRRLKF
jgi:hypothetical protein